ncbi:MULTISPECIES: glycosyltransferase [unclassified Colwellia]|uniref:glycosyltransferase family 2 protein n=1 Tax=unclassified Colwellia TaxID=196834 RepID=UPI0015F36D64|nr:MULTISPECIES: glycosyltransferase [unclassified Colwellia]MBA6358117.1 glycosyltransferase [Colwellia sp. BRX8-3]MBA6368667.1 glycosyltransferase [Colwellia sp. BRX8-5]MBA6376548.1 glycosyltransferase [Colwellia sp. BRX8-2]
MQLRSEQEIINSWKYIDKVYISVVCMTYNQEQYIKTAINSFLQQECDYKFEIIIHDDASTDTTTEIIKEYAENYPSIIRVIQQVDNKYSQKPTLPTLIALNNTKAEYIALCEGDDYWISTNKLQCQYLAMQEHKSLCISFHSSQNIYPNGSFQVGVSLGDLNKICLLSTVIRGGGAYMPTASLMFKKELLESFNQVLANAPVGDFYMQVLGSAANGALYISGLESAYRKGNEGSWSESMSHSTEKKILKLLGQHKSSIKELADFIPAEHKRDLEYALMHEYYVGARIALFSKNYVLFQSLISKCKNSEEKFGIVYSFFCNFRNYPRLLLKAYLLFTRR